MTFAPGDPRVIQRFFMGQPGVVYSRPAWPNLPPGVPYQPNRYYPGSAETYGVPIPPGVPLDMIRAANGLGALGVAQTTACSARGGTCVMPGSARYEETRRLPGVVEDATGRLCVGLVTSPSGSTAPPVCLYPVRSRPPPIPPLGSKTPATYVPPPGTPGADVPTDVQRNYSPPIINTQGMPTWAPYAMVIGGIAVIGGIIYLIGKQRNRRRNTRRRNARRRNWKEVGRRANARFRSTTPIKRGTVAAKLRDMIREAARERGLPRLTAEQLDLAVDVAAANYNWHRAAPGGTPLFDAADSGVDYLEKDGLVRRSRRR